MTKILRVDMTELKTADEELAPEMEKFGGRGLSALILGKEIDPTCDPLGKYNKLIIASGFLGGTTAPSTGRISVGGKSPLTGTIKEANVGGTAGQKLSRLGYRAIALEGMPSDGRAYVVKLDKNGAQIVRSDDLALMGNYALAEELKKRYGENIGIVCVGPAGDMKMAAASVAVTDPEGRPTRHAGRGGLGAVMGSKKVKAVVMDDTGSTMVMAKDQASFNTTVREFSKKYLASPSAQNRKTYGTTSLVARSHAGSSLPTRNYSAGQFEGAAKLTGEAFREMNLQRGGYSAHRCMPGCLVGCSVVFHGPDGNYVTSALEYETLAMCGANLGIDDVDIVAQLDRICDDTGLDTIEVGAALGVAMEGGVIPFGDGQGAIRVAKEIAEGTPLGRVVGNGAVITGRVFGVTRVAAVKGQSMAAWEPRSRKGTGVTYATSPMGADHTAQWGAGVMPQTTPKEIVDAAREGQIRCAVLDSSGFCMFADANMDYLLSLYNAKFGIDATMEDLLNYGRTVLGAEHSFNEKAGFNKTHDRLPKWMTEEPLPPIQNVFDIPDEEIDKLHNY